MGCSTMLRVSFWDNPWRRLPELLPIWSPDPWCWWWRGGEALRLHTCNTWDLKTPILELLDGRLAHYSVHRWSLWGSQRNLGCCRLWTWRRKDLNLCWWRSCQIDGRLEKVSRRTNHMPDRSLCGTSYSAAFFGSLEGEASHLFRWQRGSTFLFDKR